MAQSPALSIDDLAADYELLKALYEDAQSSLAAALAKIEDYRIKERISLAATANSFPTNSAQHKSFVKQAPSHAAPDGPAHGTHAGEDVKMNGVLLPAHLEGLQALVPIELLEGGHKVR